MSEEKFSEYIVYVDESGHASPDQDPNFPCFVLALCVFEKGQYLEQVVPELQGLKFDFWGHDMVILHEREIRKRLGSFDILNDPKKRSEFQQSLTQLIEKTDFEIIHTVIQKNGQHLPEDNLYHLALATCLEKLYDFLKVRRAERSRLHIIFEARGKREDRELELEFRRICTGENRHGVDYPFVSEMASKNVNSTGLQFADLVARPLGLKAIRPQQRNRTYDILENKSLPLHYTQSDLEL